MKKVLFTLLAFAATAIGLVVLVGYAQPVEHVAAARADVPAEPPVVFEAIVSYERHPDWRPSVDSVRALDRPDGDPGWVEFGSAGPLPMELTESRSPEHIVTTIAPGDLPFGGTWTYDLEPTETGTRVTITERGEVYHPIFRFVSRFLIGHHATMTTFLEDLGRHFGQESTVEILD